MPDEAKALVKVTRRHRPRNANLRDALNTGITDWWGQRWQLRLLPVMVVVLVGVAALFFTLSAIQFTSVMDHVWQTPELADNAAGAVFQCDRRPGPTPADDLLCRRLQMLARLETNVLQRRHDEVIALISSRIWLKYLGVMTGMILCVVGSVFILGRLADDSPTTINAEGTGWKAALATASPGLVVCVLGAALLLTNMLINPQMSTTDAPTYLPPSIVGAPAIDGGAAPSTAPGARVPDVKPD